MRKFAGVLSLFCICIFSVSAVRAQQAPQPVQGTVRSDGGDPVIGATIVIKGTQNGTTTDAQGQFRLEAAPGSTLVISSIGMERKEVPVTGTSPLNIVLALSNAKLNDVVVIGYETVSRKSVTTSIASISAKDIAPYTTGNAGNALQGKVPGLLIKSGGGLPGAQPKILIHGLSSINYNNNPLVIVDGVEVGFNDLNLLNPSDIASMDVLEDASAAAIYGARGGQGVILVTTKRGMGKPVIHVTGTTGWNRLPKIDLASASEYARVMNMEAENGGQALPFSNPDQLKGTDYWDQTFDVGRTQNYVISATGGGKGLSLYGSLGYYREDSYNATSKGGNWQKFTGRFNGDLEVSKAVKIGMSIAPRYETWLASPNNIYGAYAMDPTTAPFKTADSVMNAINSSGTPWDYTAFNPVYSLANRSSFNSVTNPAFNYAKNFDKNEFFGTQYAAYVQVTPVKNLVIKSSVEGFINVSQANNYFPKYFLAPNAYNKVDSARSSTGVDTRWKIVNTANYKFDIGDHHFDVLAGESTDKYVTKGTGAVRQDIPADNPAYQDIAGGATVIDGSGTYQPGAPTWGNMVSYFGSLRYNYKEKYYLGGTMRADASSLVNPLYRWGYFPTVSGAWIISAEPFMQDLSETVSYLKLRASWGKSGGNLPPTTSAYTSSLGVVTYPNASGGYTTGYAAGVIANPLIKWEVQQDYTFGLDATLLKNKLNVSLEKYVRNPSNLLENITVDYVLGYPQGYYPVQLANIGKMTTNGWDVMVGYNDMLTPKLRFGANFTLSHFRSIVDDLGSADPILGHEANDVISTFRSRLTKGHEPGAWYGFIVDGVFQSDADAAAYVNKDGKALQPSAQAGDLKYRDINGDGVIDNDDLTDLGSPWPKLTGGLTLTLNYGNFDFRTELYGSWGAKYFQSNLLNMNPAGHLNFESGLADKFWHGEGTSNSYPILRYPDANGNFSKMSTFFLDEANFVKCNLMQIGYTLPSKWLKGVQNLRISASVQNLFTITRYGGLNPDLPWFNTVGYNGVDNFQALPSRVYLVGVSLNL
ncbi:SusC/RagA family TonB-linked outer membrane protein [Compostibacter hankyongensis]|uniref:TonB-dependent receptor n=1 Tax=Compostibacter hankyongensis TaxID=1007089 RepID=A0ABP8FNV2_9BACT